MAAEGFWINATIAMGMLEKHCKTHENHKV